MTSSPEKVSNTAEISSGLEPGAAAERNEELLGKTELGVILAPAYREAVNLDPRLGDIDIQTIDNPDEVRHGFARPSWASESGKHEIHVRLEDLDGTLAHYQKAIDEAPDAIAIIAERMGIDVDRVTPQMMYVQSILHEMGHLTEHMDYEDNPEEFRRRNKAEKAALPIGNTTVSKLIAIDSPIRQQVEQHWDEVSQRTGAGSIDELISMQSIAYRSMTSEAHADNFAADVFLANPQLYDQLSQQSVEPYRNYPVAA